MTHTGTGTGSGRPNSGLALDLLASLDSIGGMILSVDMADPDRVLSGGAGSLITSVPDRKGGRTFAAAGAARMTDAAWTDGSRSALGSSSTYLSTPDDDDLSFGGDSWMVAIAGRTVAEAGSYTVWAGNGKQATNEGFRLFNANNGGLAIYDGGDGAGTNSVIAPVGAVVNGAYNVMIWSYDALANVCRFTSSEVGGAPSSVGPFTGGAIPDAGNALFINGAADAAYRGAKSFAYVGAWRRAATEAIAAAEVVVVRDTIAAFKGVAV